MAFRQHLRWISGERQGGAAFFPQFFQHCAVHSAAWSWQALRPRLARPVLQASGSPAESEQETFGILAYHRITELCEGVPAPTLNVTPDQLRRQLEGLLQRGYRFWPLRRLLGWHQSFARLPAKLVVLTFDDGFAGVYRHVLPLLRDLRLPATVFISTAYVDSAEPFPFDAWGRCWAGRVDREAYRPLRSEELRALQESKLVELGAHTHTHADPRESASRFAGDLQVNLEELHNRFGVVCPPFAYPFGVPRTGYVTPELVAAVRSAGACCGLTMEAAPADLKQDPFTWGRFHVAPWDTAETLEFKLSGCYSPVVAARQRWSAGRRSDADVMRELRTRLAGQGASCGGPHLGRTGRSGGDEGGEATSAAEGRGKPSPARVDHEPSASSGLASCRCGNRVRDVEDQGDVENQGDVGDQGDGAVQVSVIMPTFRRPGWLRDAMQSLLDQRLSEPASWELLIVDNGSEDSTPDVVAAAAARSPIPLRYLYEPVPGEAAARNRGIAAARGSWLAFFDDDQLASVDWLDSLLQAAHITGAPILGGRVALALPADQLRRLGSRARTSLREVDRGNRVRAYGPRELPGTGNALVAREVVDTIGPFEPSFRCGGADCDFFQRARRAGFDQWYTPQAVVYHRCAPRRLTPAALRWDARSGGAGHASYYDQPRGRAVLLASAAARLSAALWLRLPGLAWAWLQQDAAAQLDEAISLWRTEGYLRRTAAALAPRLCPQHSFFASLDFRRSRQWL